MHQHLVLLTSPFFLDPLLHCNDKRRNSNHVNSKDAERQCIFHMLLLIVQDVY